MIHVIRTQANPQQMDEMLQALHSYVKLAVDIRRGILAGGGTMHADCEAALLKDGSLQEDIWGADFNPENKSIAYGSLINIRPKQNNRSLEIADPSIREDVERIVLRLLAGA
jgi:hypothetical protein